MDPPPTCIGVYGRREGFTAIARWLKVVLTIGFVLFSVMALVTFLLSTRGSVPKSQNIETLEARLRAVDLGAFLTLTNPRDAEFLHDTLQPAAFRRVHRLRTRAALKYLRTLSWNAAILMQIGELARRNPDQSLAEAGRDLAETALRTRILILRAFLKLAPHLVVPMYSNAPEAQLLSDYSEMSRRLTLLTATHKARSRSLSIS